MPRKYRPPAARRRKSKRAAPVYVEPLAEDGGTPSPAPEAAIPQIEAPAPPPPADEQPLRASGRRDSRETAAPATKHIARDYSYVRAEVRRIVVVGGFLIAALIITALLRN